MSLFLWRKYYTVLFLGSDAISVEVAKKLVASPWVSVVDVLTPGFDSDMY